MRFIVLLLIVLGGWINVTQAAITFEEANEMLRAGNTLAAASAYEGMIAQGVRSSAIYANLARALQQQNKVAKASLNYHRALMLNPLRGEARQGLMELSERSGLRMFPPRWIHPIFERVSLTSLLVTGCLLFWIGTFWLVAIIFKNRRKVSAIVLSASFVSLGAFILGVSHWGDPRIADANLAIVVSNQAAAALNQPVETSNTVASLPPGSSVTVLSEQGNWNYCQLANGKNGWVLSSVLSFVNPDRLSKGS